MHNINTLELADVVEGELFGPIITLKGNFTFLNKALENDIVIRHWIDSTGIEIAHEKKIACLITQNPKQDAIEMAEKLDFPLIVTPHIEYATAYALKNTIKQVADSSFKIAVTGTNGKSTTSHLLYTIFSDLGYNTYTNTDAESEGNTLIDPRVSVELNEFSKNNSIDVISLEVSEVQGWDDKLMKNHAYQMIKAADSDAVIITNASLDHINLVKSFDELLNEISGAARSLENKTKDSLLVLNYDDENIRNMNKLISNDNVQVMYFGTYDENNLLDISYKEKIGIYSQDKLYIQEKDLPFTSKHFIQDIMAALAVCEYKKLDKTQVINSLNNYKALARRFIQLRQNPIIIDDFAHNPSGIKLTIENGSKLGEKLFVVNAIRGSRGIDINQKISEALSEVLHKKNNYSLTLTKSVDVVNHLNEVLLDEEEIFTKILDDNNISYDLIDSLEESLLAVYNQAQENDVILLLGAQGMDPASKILSKHEII